MVQSLNSATGMGAFGCRDENLFCVDQADVRSLGEIDGGGLVENVMSE
jgi:hypothetical protein